MVFETTMLLDGLAFAEGPRWHEGKLWFSDMHAQRVMTVDMKGNAETVLEMEDRPSGLGWLPDGRLLIVSMIERRLLRLDPHGLVMVADLQALASSHCNDMVVDAQGRAYIGNYGFDARAGQTLSPAEIVMVTPSGDARVAADEMIFPNGMAITPEGNTLIVSETYASRLTAFHIEPDGSLMRRRVWAELEGGNPDGICIDAEGAIWVASTAGSQVIRVREGGEVADRVDLPDTTYACMLGGPDHRTLFVCTAGPVGDDRLGARRGQIHMVKVAIPGTGLP